MLHLIGLAALLSVQAAAAPQPPCAFVPAGELAARIAMVHHRFAELTEPAFTDKFILADVELDPAYPRRFSEFSGDISGRYIGAMAMLPPDDPKAAENLDRIVNKTLGYQRADGRFGNDKLSFAAADVGPDQMALLWGNGRLLVGLLEYNSVRPSDRVLDASRGLGDFLLKVFDDCAKPEVMERLRGKAANGFICFTQLNEGLELLARATGEAKYRDVAKRTLDLLEAPGDQHTHGYLTTLRGHMMIYESTHEKALLDAVVTRYREIIDIGAVKTNGGVLEYFKKDYHRDEGCSEADFVRLSLQLWRATGEAEYMNRAEHCLYNSLFAGQFATGDFGHHDFDDRGYIPPNPGPGRAWWCCTMHGLRALRDVLDNVITQNGDSVTLNLYFEGRWQGKGVTMRVESVKGTDSSGNPAPRMEVTKTSTIPRLGFTARRAEWMSGGTVSSGKDGTFEIDPGYGLRLMDREGNFRLPGNLAKEKPTEAAIFYGPWLMGIDAASDPMFHGEPVDNTLLLPDEKTLSGGVKFGGNDAPLLSGPHINLAYTHSGFSDLCKVTLRPVSEQTAHEPGTLTFWNRVKQAN
jgi:hypothetical protein